MLTLDKIKQNYSDEIFRRNPRAVLVEYLQHELLDSIFKQPGSQDLSFMGGTAIRIIYGSDRFSEDLDFDNFALDFVDFEKLLKNAVADMSNKGFDLEIRFVEKGAFHCYIKFPKLLFSNDLSQYKDEKILVRIDAVRKEKLIEPEIYILDKFSVYRKVLVNTASVILMQKLIAIIERKREKGRDFYDVSYLLGFAKPNYDFLKKTYNNINRDELKQQIIKRIEKLNMKELAQDVEPFLIEPRGIDRILSFREYIEQKL